MARIGSVFNFRAGVRVRGGGASLALLSEDKARSGLRLRTPVAFSFNAGHAF